MPVQFKKDTIKGKINATVLYKIPNFRVEGDLFKFDAFRFYSPAAGTVDESGGRYFDVPADEADISRDDTLDLEIQIIVIYGQETQAIEILKGAAPPDVNVGIDGDLIATIDIPADPARDILVEYKEVIE